MGFTNVGTADEETPESTISTIRSDHMLSETANAQIYDKHCVLLAKCTYFSEK